MNPTAESLPSPQQKQLGKDNREEEKWNCRICAVGVESSGHSVRSSGMVGMVTGMSHTEGGGPLADPSWVNLPFCPCIILFKKKRESNL